MAEGDDIVVKVDGERGLEAALAQVASTAQTGDNNGIEDGLPLQSPSKLEGGADGWGGEEEGNPTTATREGHAQLAYQDQHQDQKEDDADRITLPAFRLLCLSNPLLDTFFSSQLPASFRLEVVDRASLNGTSVWHDIPAASSSKLSTSAAIPHSSSSSSSLSSSSSSNTITPSGTPSSTSFFPFGSGIPSSPLKSSQMKKASSSAVAAAAEAPSSFSASGSSTTIFSASGPASSPSSSSSLNPSSSSPALFRAYSKDVSTGVVGKIGGFLNTFLGDEVKTKVDQLADSLGEKLHTKVIRGPMPSFANLSSSSGGGGIQQGGASNGRGGGGVLGMDDLRAMEEERRERRRIREQEDREEEEQEEEERQAKGAARSGGGTGSGDKRGINLLAAQESLRRATEAVVEGRQAPTTDSSHNTVGAAGDEDEGDEEIVGEDGLI